MKIPIYQVDAFTGRLFGGNPAAICLLDDWLDDEIMLKIAQENNLAETAFVKLDGSTYPLRWFTPEFEIDLCGHATLASAHVLFNELDHQSDEVIFDTVSGQLSVIRKHGLLEMNFPSRPPKPSNMDEKYLQALSIQPNQILKSRDYILMYENQGAIKSLRVNPNLLDASYFGKGGIICTAKGDEADFVSRSFWPEASVFEDPVTGSSHCSLTPYWSKLLGKKEMVAHQLSERGGVLHCVDAGDRVLISGKAVSYLKGEITLE